MKQLILTPKNIRQGNLLLINSSYPLLYSPQEEALVPVFSGFQHILLLQNAANMLKRITALLSCSNAIVPVSGYRSFREQKALYENCLIQYGEDFARKYVARPGCSEHQSGLAIDLAESAPDIDNIKPNFPYDGICQIFRETAPTYGFIERYLKGRENITGISHEPWHFRFVGYPHSKLIHIMDITLEEYMDYIRIFSIDNPFRVNLFSKAFTIFFVPVQQNSGFELELPDDIPSQVSGNNVDGCIVTLWSNPT